MTDVTAEMTKNAGQNTNRARKLSSDNTALDRRYRQIGIPAVAAAARYQGIAMNPAHAPAPTKPHDRAGEAA